MVWPIQFLKMKMRNIIDNLKEVYLMNPNKILLFVSQHPLVQEKAVSCVVSSAVLISFYLRQLEVLHAHELKNNR